MNILNFFRLSVYSIGAMALAACARVSGNTDTAYVDDNRRADPPENALSGLDLRRYQEGYTDADIDALESRIQALNVELRDLQHALQLMGPLEDGSVDYAERTQNAHVEVEMASEASVISDAEQYEEAPTIENSKSLFQRANLAVYPTRGAAEADWERLDGDMNLSDLTPRYDEVGEGVRISVGPFENEAKVSEMCEELSRAAGACSPAGREGMMH